MRITLILGAQVPCSQNFHLSIFSARLYGFSWFVAGLRGQERRGLVLLPGAGILEAGRGQSRPSATPSEGDHSRAQEGIRTEPGRAWGRPQAVPGPGGGIEGD